MQQLVKRRRRGETGQRGIGVGSGTVEDNGLATRKPGRMRTTAANMFERAMTRETDWLFNLTRIEFSIKQNRKGEKSWINF